MKAMICEMCQSNDLVKQDGMYVCQHCGTKYSVEEARKLLGAVTIDRTDELKNLFILARRARNEMHHEDAEKYYGLILQSVPDNWEAAFFHVYFHYTRSSMYDLINSANAFVRCIDEVVKLIKDLDNSKEQDEALSTLTFYCSCLANGYSKAAKDDQMKSGNNWRVFAEYFDRIAAAEKIYTQLENCYKKYFPQNKDARTSLQKEYLNFLSIYGKSGSENKEKMSRVSSEIQSYDETYVPPKKADGCYIATAIYGSYDCPQVWTLRRFRDTILAKSWYGRTFIKIYYTVSPTLVKHFGKSNWFKRIWTPFLDRMVKRLNWKGIENTPYNDRKW